MKKILARFLSILFMFGMCFGLTGCTKTKEECIPEKLGEPEGLYLYYDNYRSLTDGTEVETLISEVTVDGVRYTDEELEIVNLEYVTATKEIVYSLALTKEESTSYCIWHYNYDTKESGLIMQTNTYAWISVSDTYVYLEFGSRNSSGTLLDLHLNVVEDSFNGNYVLLGDCLYKDPYYNFGKFSWWKDGEFYEIVTIKKTSYGRDTYVTGDYAYLFYDSVLFLVDMNTGEYKTHNFAEEEILKDWHGFYGNGAKNYCITTSQITETNLEYFPLETGCKLYCLQGLEISLIYTFNESYQVEFDGCNERYLNFEIREYKTHWLFEDRSPRSHGYYDLEKNKFVKGKTKTITQRKENFKIGEYEFYSNKVKYGPLMGHYYCYYLHRITDGEDEILLYHFDESNGLLLNPVLFDDIYTK